MPIIQIIPPTEEPVSLEETKLHLRVDIDSDNMLISMMISAARQAAEAITRRALVSQQLKLVLDAFPGPSMNVSSANWYGPNWGIGPGPLSTLRPENKTGLEIILPNPPLISVDSVKYVDPTTQSLVTLDPSQYYVDTVSEPARITPAYGASWPTTLNRANAVEVTFTCGYASAAQVPEGIKSWILLRVGALYENREEFVVAQRVTVSELPFMNGLLNPYRVVTF